MARAPVSRMPSATSSSAPISVICGVPAKISGSAPAASAAARRMRSLTRCAVNLPSARCALPITPTTGFFAVTSLSSLRFRWSLALRIAPLQARGEGLACRLALRKSAWLSRPLGQNNSFSRRASAPELCGALAQMSPNPRGVERREAPKVVAAPRGRMLPLARASGAARATERSACANRLLRARGASRRSTAALINRAALARFKDRL